MLQVDTVPDSLWVVAGGDSGFCFLPAHEWKGFFGFREIQSHARECFDKVKLTPGPIPRSAETDDLLFDRC